MTKMVDLLCVSCGSKMGEGPRQVPESVTAVRTQQICKKCLDGLQTSLRVRKGYVRPVRKRPAVPADKVRKLDEQLRRKEAGDFDQDSIPEVEYHFAGES